MIRLTRTISVSTFDVQGTVALGRERPEFLAVARLAADLQRPIGAHDVLRELLGPLPEVLGWRVIDRCVALGLLERDRRGSEAVLSNAGYAALEHGEVLVPEEGTWRLFVVDDPLVPATLVHAQRLEAPPVHEERRGAKEAKRTNGARSRPERPSDRLRACAGAAPVVSVRNGHLFQLVALAEQGAGGPSGRLTLTLSWTGEPSVRLEGELPVVGDAAASVDATVPLADCLDGWAHDDLWKALVSHATRVSGAVLDGWHRKADALVVPMAFASLSESARRAFHVDLAVPASELRGLGRFDATTLTGVNVVPAADADAEEWLAWLQWETIDDYLTPPMIERRASDLRSRFPYHAPRARSADELLATARGRRDDRAWFLLAPSDLGLWSTP